MYERIFSGIAHITGGSKDAHVTTVGEYVDADIRASEEVGGPGNGTNPAQLMAAAYGACFHTMLNKELLTRGYRKVTPPEVEAETEAQHDTDGGVRVVWRLKATLYGIPEEELDDIVEQADKFCPFSKAIDGGNTEVKIEARVAEPQTV